MSRPEVVVTGPPRLSVEDWPGRHVATVLTRGCPWCCSPCRHPALGGHAPDRPPGDAPRWADVVAFLADRRGLLDGVVFSGGEPTLHAGLPDAVDAVRALGLPVALHTHGAWPARLARLLPLVDRVSLDIKHLPSRYRAVTGRAPAGRRAFESLAVLVRSGVEHEVRTTVDPCIHTRADLLALGEHLHALGLRQWVLDGAGLDDLLEEADLAWAARSRQTVAGSSVTSG